MLCNKKSLTHSLQLAIRNERLNQLAGSCGYSVRGAHGVNKELKFRNLSEFFGRKQGENNPEYHRAPRCFVENFKRYQEKQSRQCGKFKAIRIRNPQYRWADFRRRMVYGIYDI